jgi:hypothetical protein
MSEEPETTAPDLVERLEADLVEAKAAIESVPARVSVDVAKVHAEVDTFYDNVVRNVISEIPTRVHNFITAEKEALKDRIAKLF